MRARDSIDNWHFYLIYNMFRSAGIIQGVYKRGLDGNASSEKALEYADAARMRSAARLGISRREPEKRLASWKIRCAKKGR